MRYPLIDFHGNVGNIGGDGPAASRYTEARLAKITEDGMLKGIKKNCVDFIPNYDETTEEPISLPSIFPNLLCNPNAGIGVAMACSWAPHNLGEVAAAIKQYIDGEEPILPGPDFPTGGIIINKDSIPAIMKTGHGSVKIRAKYEINGQNIVFTEIPYGTNIENIMDEIGELSDSKEIEGISNIRNESNKHGIRIVIECNKTITPNTIINKLFAKTHLQDSFSYNQVALVNKVPTELNLKDCIKIYVDYNIKCITRELEFDLNKAKDRLEIVEGLLKALEDIDNIIALIKKSESTKAAKIALIEKYNFSERQVSAILAMKLGSLAKLEKIELEKEAKELKNKINDLINILESKERKTDILLTRLFDLVKKYGDKRRTELTQIEIKSDDKIIQQVIPEDVIVTLSDTGNLNRVPKKNFKIQRKRGKGIKSKDEIIISTIVTNTTDYLLLFTNKGQMFKLLVNNIPTGTNNSKGTNIANLIKISDNEKVVAISSLLQDGNAKYVVFFTKQGLIKKTSLDEYKKIKKTVGIHAINIKENDAIANVEFISDENVLLITKKGMAIYFETKNISPIGRVTMGIKAIKLNPDDEVLIGIPIKDKNTNIGFISTKGYGKRVSLTEFTLQNKNGKGVIVYKPNETYGELAGAAIIKDENNILLCGQPNSICIAATDLPLLSRTGYGNILIKSNVSSITVF